MKHDVRMYASTSNSHPSKKDCDYKSRGKYASIDINKDLEATNSDTLYLALTSKVGLKILFAYCYEHELPPGDILRNNLGK